MTWRCCSQPVAFADKMGAGVVLVACHGRGCVVVWLCCATHERRSLLRCARGTAIRFDELIREVRVALLRKHPNKWHAQDLEKVIWLWGG